MSETTTLPGLRELTYGELVEAAKAQVPDKDDYEFDDTPAISRGVDGAWVAAWVWVHYPEEGEGDGTE
jgi:hypothetical protein